MGKPVKIFVSYSHQDAAYLADDSLLGFLRGLEKDGVELWTDQRLVAGQAWDDVLRRRIADSRIALVLVSQAFLDSAYCTEVEITNFLERSRVGGLLIFPIILSPCEWERHDWLRSHQFLPLGGRTIEEHYRDPGERKRLYLEVRRQLRIHVSKIQGRESTAPLPLPATAELAVTAAEATDGAKTAAEAPSAVIRTLVRIRLLEVTALLERLGDVRAAEVLGRHERLARDLLAARDGREIDYGEGFLLLFERPIDAVRFALGYQRGLKALSDELEVGLEASVAIHLGEVVLRRNSPEDTARGAKPLTVEGLARPTVAAVLGLARPGQILLTRGVFELARRGAVGLEADGGPVRWVAHGLYYFEQSDNRLELFEVGDSEWAPLQAPADTPAAHRLEGATGMIRVMLDDGVEVSGREAGVSGQLPAPPPAAPPPATPRPAAPEPAAPRPAAPRPAAPRPAAPQPAAPQPTARPSARRLPRPALAAVLAAAALVAALAGWLLWGRGGRVERLALAGDGVPTVAVAALEGCDALPAWQPIALAEMLHLELGAVAGLAVLPRGAAGAAADVTVGGECRAPAGSSDTLAVAPRAESAAGEGVDLPRASAEATRLDELARRIGRDVARALSLRPAAAGEALPALGGEAAVLRGQALDSLRLGDAAAARKRLEAALAQEGEDPRLLADMADALWQLGREEEARDLLERAAAAGGARPLRLLVRARTREAQRRRLEAGALYTALWRAGEHAGQEPLDLGLRVAVAQAYAGWDELARSTLEAVRALPQPAAGDPRLDLAAAQIARRARRYDDQQEAARSALEAAERRAAPFLAARGRYLEGVAALELGRLDQATEILEDARRRYGELEHPNGEADVLIVLGNAAAVRGDAQGEKAFYDAARRLYLAAGNRRAEARTLANQALILQDRGELATSTVVLEQALERFRDLGDRTAEALTRLNLTVNLTAQGRLREAFEAQRSAVETLERLPSGERFEVEADIVLGHLQWYAGSLAEARATFERALAASGDGLAAAGAQVGLATVLSAQGELEPAAARFARLAEVSRAAGNRALEAGALAGSGAIRTVRGELEEAREALETALAIQLELADPGPLAATRQALARLALAAGRPAEAVERAREALAELEAGERPLERVAAHETLARALLAGGRTGAARAEVEAARALLGETEALTFALPLRATAARVQAAMGEREAAREVLRQALADATAAGFRGLELEIAIALAELDLAGGGSAVRARLGALAAEARDAGYRVLAARAEASAGR